MNPRRYSQIERALHILDKSTTVDILKDDQYLLFLFKKTERISSAIYILTSLISDEEPLKWELRNASLQLLKDTLSFKQRITVISTEFTSGALSTLATTLSLFDLAYVSDLISPMNFAVMKRELQTLQSSIEAQGRSGTALSHPHIEETFFGLSKDLFSAQARAGAATEMNVKQEESLVYTVSDFERLGRAQGDSSQGHQNKDNVLYKKPMYHRVASHVSTPHLQEKMPPKASADLKEQRKQRIIEVVRQKGTTIIKDFLGVIQGCSEKTIQRLLVEMVQSGILKREGERRWSRYSLAPEGVPRV